MVSALPRAPSARQIRGKVGGVTGHGEHTLAQALTAAAAAARHENSSCRRAQRGGWDDDGRTDGSPATSHERETRVFRRRDASARARGSKGRRSRADPTSTTEEGNLEWEVVTGGGWRGGAGKIKKSAGTSSDTLPHEPRRRTIVNAARQSTSSTRRREARRRRGRPRRENERPERNKERKKKSRPNAERKPPKKKPYAERNETKSASARNRKQKHKREKRKKRSVTY